MTHDVGAKLEEQEDSMIMCLARITRWKFMSINRVDFWDQMHHPHISHYNKNTEEFLSLLRCQWKQWSAGEAYEYLGVSLPFLEVSMAEKRASNSSLSMDESTATDKMQPSPRTSGIVVTNSMSQGAIPPLVSTPSTWPQYGLPQNYL
ncbi:hypothetical protein PIB30_101980 [Stylosanthes scabra]|uniref:Uncharacterized protein n=1 Tax=Stylosanthes scabra TaxID=79078 RepID=A0ABU6QXY6_9FABA|nr:hypothetical protein [Stylosanthes scabra]